MQQVGKRYNKYYMGQTFETKASKLNRHHQYSSFWFAKVCLAFSKKLDQYIRGWNKGEEINWNK